jgi:type I restriction enzyme R subunit
MAIAEWPTANGPADYALFIDTQCVALAEAKRRRKNVSTAIDQAERYSKGFAPSGDVSVPGGPWGEFRVPFVFSANGRAYLKQIETESGIWFRDVRRPANLRCALVDWVTPQGLKERLEIDRDAAQAALKAQPFDFGFPLRPYQRRAIETIEATLNQDQRAMLVAMATGTKTKLAIALLYRLLSAKRFRRICFVVDRNALGGQAADEFKTTRVVSVRTFANIFGLKELSDVAPDSETRVHICPILNLLAKRVPYRRRWITVACRKDEFACASPTRRSTPLGSPGSSTKGIGWSRPVMTFLNRGRATHRTSWRSSMRGYRKSYPALSIASTKG